MQLRSLEPDELYRERNAVDPAIPVMRGDVFSGVALPGLGDGDFTVQVHMHPCTMREKGRLRSRVSVGPVSKHPGNRRWEGNYNVMLLPDLFGDGGWYSADFRETTPVSIHELSLSRRVATLSEEGRLVLQQRQVKSQTRVSMNLRSFREQMATIEVELEAQESWVLLALEHHDGEAAQIDIERYGSEFQDWLDEDGRARRRELEEPIHHARLRREAFHAAESRYSA